jgi:hypothetical protein
MRQAGLERYLPPSVVAHGWGAVVRLAQEQLRRSGSVMLRQAKGGGGLGNIVLKASDLVRTDETVVARLDRLVQGEDRSDWDAEPVLVEPLLDLACSPSVLVRVDDVDRVRVMTNTMQIMKDFAFVGSVMPSGVDTRLLDEMVDATVRYACVAAEEGARGYLNIDWGVVSHDTSLGRYDTLVAFESNYRYGGNSHVLAIKQRLRPENAHGVTVMSNDALKVPDDVRLADALAYMAQRGIAWDDRRGTGVVVSIPPAGGSMGYVVLSDTRGDTERMNALMSAFPSSVR